MSEFGGTDSDMDDDEGPPTMMSDDDDYEPMTGPVRPMAANRQGRCNVCVLASQGRSSSSTDRCTCCPVHFRFRSMGGEACTCPVNDDEGSMQRDVSRNRVRRRIIHESDNDSVRPSRQSSGSIQSVESEPYSIPPSTIPSLHTDSDMGREDADEPMEDPADHDEQPVDPPNEPFAPHEENDPCPEEEMTDGYRWISQLAFSCHRLHQRGNTCWDNHLLRMGRLTEEYVISSWVTCENDRINACLKAQDDHRTDKLSSIRTAVDAGKTTGKQIGKVRRMNRQFVGTLYSVAIH